MPIETHREEINEAPERQENESPVEHNDDLEVKETGENQVEV